MASFLVTSLWRGSLHIDPMRLVETEEKAWDIADGLTGGTARVYEVFPDKPPRLCKKPKDQK